MHVKQVVLATILYLLVYLTILSPARLSAAEGISFGVLPVIQALPLFVAHDRGLYKNEGLEVQLVTFRSGLEKDAAMAAGKTKGYFGDMLTSIILGANQVPMRMVATVYNTTGDQRMFAILAAPGTGRISLTELAEMGIAGSSNTVIEYITEKLLQRESPGSPIRMIETKDILARVPMLLGGQVPGAVLPEPLVTLVENKGATVVADDRGLGLTPTTLLFTQDFIEKKTDEVRAFLRATSAASDIISRNPESVRSVMIKYTRVPEPMQQSFKVPTFDPPSAPGESLVMDSYNWLRKKGILKRELTFDQMVRGDLLPGKQ
jgi:NitT/TauT family transport system substrate-binding protein